MTPRQPDLPWLRAQLSRSVDVAASYVIFPGRSFTYHGDVAPGFGPFVVPFLGLVVVPLWFPIWA